MMTIKIGCLDFLNRFLSGNAKNKTNIFKSSSYGILGLQTFPGKMLFEGFSDAKVSRLIPKGQLPKLRREVVAEYLRVMRGFSLGEKAQLVIGFARAIEATDTSVLSGLKLRGWTQQGNPPGWAENAIFSLMLDKGWVPTPVPLDSSAAGLVGKGAVYALFIRWWILSNSYLSTIDEVVDSLPENMDRDVAKDWVELFAGHIGRGGNQLVCYIVDKRGNALTPLHTSLLDLRDAIQNKTYGISIKKCARNYFLCKGYVTPEVAMELNQ